MINRVLWRWVLLTALMTLPLQVWAQGTISTLAGDGIAGFAGDGGPAGIAQLNSPLGIALAGGILYIADRDNHRIRAINLTNGVISTVAGIGTPGFSGDSGLASAAQLNLPSGVAVSATTLYIADRDNHRIRSVDLTSGIISTLAGTGTSGFNGDGGLASAALLNDPVGVAVSGNILYIADQDNHRIRAVDLSSGIISTFAGTGTAFFGGDGGLASAAELNTPVGVTAVGTMLYIADRNNHRIRAINLSNNIISTVAGSTQGLSGDGGLANAAQLNLPSAAVEVNNTLYIADLLNHRIRAVDLTSGIITTAAGIDAGFNGDGGPATIARLNQPIGLAQAGTTLYIADRFNQRIRVLAISTGFTVTESGGNTEVNESGTTDNVDIVLTAQPLSNVVLTATSADLGEATVTSATLTFTPANWNIPQTLTVAGVDDSLIDGNQTTVVTIAVDAANSDDSFDALPSQTVNVLTTDNDSAGFDVSESGGATEVNESGTTDSFDVVLTLQPNTDVVLTISSADSGEAAISSPALTFTPLNWNMPQSVTVTGVDDNLVDGNQITTITVAVDPSQSDDNFDALANRLVNVTVSDNDSAGFNTTETDGNTQVTEVGTTDSFEVVLSSQPLSDVVFTVISTDPNEATATPATLIFTPANWNNPQTVTVTGVEDNLDDGDQIVLVTIAVDPAQSDDNFDALANRVINVTIIQVGAVIPTLTELSQWLLIVLVLLSAWIGLRRSPVRK